MPPVAGRYALARCAWPPSSEPSGACITAGVLILLFVAYQLWGTGIREAQAQSELETEFEERIGADLRAADEVTTTTAPGSTTEPALRRPPGRGRRIAHLRIPAIGVDKIVVSGVQVADLKRGPGHYPDSPLPGQPGNAAIAGHRTTYGAPFNRLDELEQGDEILVTTVQGAFRYEVRETLIVTPTRSRCSTTTATTASPSRRAIPSTRPGSASSWSPR